MTPLLHGTILTTLLDRQVGGDRGRGHVLVGLGLPDDDIVGHGSARANLASRVVGQQDLHGDTQHTGAHGDVAHGTVDVLVLGLTGGDEVAITELHALGAGTSELARDDAFATLGTILHDEAQDAVAGAAGGKTSQQLVAQGLALSDSAQTAVLDALGEELDLLLREVEALLHKGGKLADAAALVTKHVLSAGGTDDDLSAEGGGAHLDTRVAILAELAGQELVQFGLEDAILDELPLLGDLGSGHYVVGPEGGYKELEANRLP